jgi:glycosyl transferase family 25
MKLYLINLERRPDRLATMRAQAEKLGLGFVRIAAVDAGTTDPGDRFTAGPLGKIPKGDQCCTLSHVLAWRAFLASGEPYAAILEDDVVLGDRAALVLKDWAWIAQGLDLIKLEHYGPKHQAVLLSDMRTLANGFRLGAMRSRHTGAAAYILSRRAAEMLCAIARFNLPVDHLLFNPNNSPLFATLKPVQLLPAVARQQDFVGDRSDIESWRVGLRRMSLSYVKRELVRFFYDVKLLPRQLALAATGKARFVKIADG